MTMDFKQYAAHIWAVADLLRGDYKQADYGKVILPLTVLRRLDGLGRKRFPAQWFARRAARSQTA